MYGLNFITIILIRIIASIIFGFAIGLERELTNKYAGLRTNILVCLGSCLFTILSIYAFPTAVDQAHPQAFGDPARIAAQILTGIGFIGGGTVLRHGSSVYGLTTAATLWVAAAIGMASGAGMLHIALIATILSVGVLVFIRVFERNVLISSIKNTKNLKIIATCKDENADTIHNYILENINYIHEISKENSEDKDDLIKITASIDLKGKKQVQSLYKKLKDLKGLDSLLIQDRNA